MLSHTSTICLPTCQLQGLVRQLLPQDGKYIKRPRHKLRVSRSFSNHSISTVEEESSLTTPQVDDRKDNESVSTIKTGNGTSTEEDDDCCLIQRPCREAHTDPREQFDLGTMLFKGNDLSATTDLEMSLESSHHEFLISQVLEVGADIDDPDDMGTTPLLYTIEHSYIRTAMLLIEKGANVNVANKDGETPFSKAREMSQWCVVEELINSRRLDRLVLLQKMDGDDRLPLHDMCAHGSLRSVKTLLEYYKVGGVFFIARGGTPSSIASATNKQDIVDYLTRYQNSPYYPTKQHY